jgi:integrase
VPGYAPLIVLLAFTGMRIREALGLCWQDVDLDAGAIRLRWQLAKDDPHPEAACLRRGGA